LGFGVWDFSGAWNLELGALPIALPIRHFTENIEEAFLHF
jgi:hypothetical protein